MAATNTTNGGKGILIIGGGVAGLTAAVEAAEAGCRVILVEKEAYLGGRVARTNQFFPKLCPPACGLEINFQRIRRNPRIRVLTLAEVESIQGAPGDYEATVKIGPRCVTSSCTLCNACTEVCPAQRLDDFNMGLCKTRGAYLPFPMAFPAQYVIDRSACPAGCHACADACKYGAVNLAQQPERHIFRVAAVVAATGWVPYDATRLANLGFGRHANVVTNAILERLAASNGPTGGRILRPSDGQPPKSVAFVQCAGSRDENHLPYCSGVCCSVSLKQCTYLRSMDPKTEITVFYIDLRTPGRLQDFRAKVMAGNSVRLVRGKVGKIEEDAASGDLIVTAEDTLNGGQLELRVNLVVLATGMVPATQGLPAGFSLDEFGFVTNGGDGLYAAGCAKRPEEVSASVREGAGAALKALQSMVRSAHHA